HSVLKCSSRATTLTTGYLSLPVTESGYVKLASKLQKPVIQRWERELIPERVATRPLLFDSAYLSSIFEGENCATRGVGSGSRISLSRSCRCSLNRRVNSSRGRISGNAS